jgi:hypothetical protein
MNSTGKRKKMVGTLYVDAMKKVLDKFKSLKRNTANYTELKDLILHKLRPYLWVLPPGSNNTHKGIIQVYEKFIQTVQTKVQKGVNICQDMYVEGIEIKMFAEQYNLKIVILSKTPNSQYVETVGVRNPVRTLYLVVQNEHYTTMRPPPGAAASTGKTPPGAAASSSRNQQPGAGSRSQTKSYGGGANNNNNQGSNASTGRKKRTYNQSGNNRQGSNNRKYNNGNFNPESMVDTLFDSLRDQQQVPAKILRAAREYGLGSREFEKVFRPYIKSLPGSKGCSVSPLMTRGQSDVYNRAKIMAELSLEFDDNHVNRGLLVHANTGSGKTLMCLSIFLAYWATGRTMYVITTTDNRDNNNEVTYLNNIKRFFPKHYKILLDKYKNEEEIRKQIFKRVERSGQIKMNKINFMSLEVFANKLGLGERGTKDNILQKEEAVIVFDESHNLFKKIEGRLNARSPQKILRKLMNMNQRERRNVHIFFLSATPIASDGQTTSGFDNWFKVFSVVAPVLDRYFKDGKMPYVVLQEAFQKNKSDRFIEKYVAPLMVYIDQRFDLSQHACVKDVRTSVKSTKWFYGALVHTMYDGGRVDQAYMRRMANVLGLELKSIKVLTKEVVDIFREKGMVMRIKKQVKTHEWLLSPKAVAIAKFVASHKGKHFIYVAEKSQAKVLRCVLMHFYGFWMNRNNNSGGGKYYGNSGRSNKKNKPGVIMLESGKQLKEGDIAQKFNDPANDDGSIYRCVIASGNMYEGVNFETIKYVHVVTPMKAALDEQQLSGRGVRQCSHQRLNVQNRNVTVMRWFLEPPGDTSMLQMVKYLKKSTKKKEHVKELASLLEKVENMMGRFKNKGPGFYVREQYLRDPTALALWNFERKIQNYLRGKPPGTNKDRILIIGGAQCK